MRLPKHREPIHPGVILQEEFLIPLGISQRQLAQHIGWDPSRLNEIIKGKRDITEESALILSDALGPSPGFWLNMQQQYDLWHALQKHKSVPRFQAKTA